MEFVNEIESALKINAKKEFLPMQSGDVKSTHADCKKLEKWIDFRPNTSLKEGIKIFVEWYKEYYKYD